jgi:hypothetical protein
LWNGDDEAFAGGGLETMSIPLEYVIIIPLLLLIIGAIAVGAIRAWWRERKNPHTYGEGDYK